MNDKPLCCKRHTSNPNANQMQAVLCSEHVTHVLQNWAVKVAAQQACVSDTKKDKKHMLNKCIVKLSEGAGK